MLIPDGPFAGQMWVADVTYGGIQRAFLEKVEGEYQGAYFRMTQGLESGLTHMALEEDGSIVVGGLGAGGNWGQEGKAGFGLQKLVPNGTQTFDIQKMELADGGFDLTYTKPLSEETAADLASKYRARQWTYVPTSSYGGPKVGEEELTVTEATLSEDRKTVSLELDGLKPGRVVYVRSPRPFEAEGGEPLLSTEAWYTLNALPGYVAPVGDGLYELEDGLLTGGAQFDTEHAGFSGTGYVSGFGTEGAAVEVEVDAEKAGDYRLALRYANGPNPSEGPKTVTLTVNGDSRQITLPSTGTWPTYRLYLDEVALDAGTNTIAITHAAGDDGHVNLDSLRLAPAGVTRYEAEEATLGGGATAQTEHAGFSGTGYVGGYQDVGASTTFEVTALADAATEVVLGYVNGPHPAPGVKDVSLYVNDQFVKKLALPSTGEWNDYGTFSETLMLRAGANAVSIRYDEGDDGNVNLDYLDVTQNEPVQCGTAVGADDEFDGEALDRCRWTTVLNEDPSGYALTGGKLEIDAQEGDIVGGTFTARNVFLQPAPTDGSWAARTTLSIDGTDDYVQAGLVARAGSEWGKLVVMRNPEGQWVLELARPAGWQNSAPLPAGAQQDITLELFASEGRLRGRYSLDDGATWTEVGAGFPLSGLANPSIGLAAYNGTGAEVAAFERFTVGEPPLDPETCEPAAPEPGYTMLFDGTRASTEDWTMAGPGSISRASDCTLFTEGGLGLLWHEDPIDHPYSLKLEWKMAGDDNSGVFVGFPDPGTDPWVAVDHGYEIQIDATDDPDSTTGAVYNFKAADTAARDAVLEPPGEWNSYELVVEGNRIRVYLNGALINDYTSTDPERMTTPSFIGLQNHGNGDDVWFRDIQIKDLTAVEPRDSTTTATASPATVEVGEGSQVTVTVAADGAAPTGDVTLKSADTVLGTGELVDGGVTIATGAFDTAGTWTLTAEYAGDETTNPSTGTVVVTVEPKAGGSGNPPGGNPGGGTRPVGGPGGGNPPGGNPGGGNPGGGRPALVVRGKADANRLRRRAALRVRCSAATAPCTGALRLRSDGRTLGKGRFAVAAGADDTLRITLNRKARQLLAQRRGSRCS